MGIAKYLPIVVGALVGWFLFHPPKHLLPKGPLGTVILVAAAQVRALQAGRSGF